MFLNDYLTTMKDLSKKPEITIKIRFNTDWLSNPEVPMWRALINESEVLVNTVVSKGVETHTSLDFIKVNGHMVYKHHVTFIATEFKLEDNCLIII